MKLTKDYCLLPVSICFGATAMGAGLRPSQWGAEDQLGIRPPDQRRPHAERRTKLIQQGKAMAAADSMIGGRGPPAFRRAVF